VWLKGDVGLNTTLLESALVPLTIICIYPTLPYLILLENFVTNTLDNISHPFACLLERDPSLVAVAFLVPSSVRVPGY
jgi:hypothetical protein